MAKAKLPVEVNAEKIQVLTPTRIEAVSAGGVFTPTGDNRVFCVDTETTVQINGTGDTFTMPAGMSIGIIINNTYTLGSSCSVLVM